MRWWIFGLLFSLFGGIGFAGGFYFAMALQKQIAVLVGTAIVLAVLTWIGSGADLVGLLCECYIDRRKQERIPKLDYAGIISGIRDSYNLEGKDYPRRGHFLRIKKITGEGYAKQCEGFLTVDSEDSTINYSPTVWAHTDVRRYEIGGQMDLLLFITDDRAGLIIFPMAKMVEGFSEDKHTLADFANAQLMVNINAERIQFLKPYTNTIKRIIEEGNKNNRLRSTSA